MSVTLTIPDSVTEAIRLPESRLEQGLLEELAVALYADGILSFGKARELVGADKRDFGRLLARSAIPRHYRAEDLRDDAVYARGE